MLHNHKAATNLWNGNLGLGQLILEEIRHPSMLTSEMYSGTTIVSIPTPNPAIARPVDIHSRQSSYTPKIPINLPVKSMGMFTAPHWIADPITKITTATLMDSFRPMRSATGPLVKDPAQAAARKSVFSRPYGMKYPYQGNKPSSNVDTNHPLNPLSEKTRGKRAPKDSMVITPLTTPWS